MKIQKEKAVDFLQRLIRINSVNPPGNELEVAEAIAAHTKEAGLQTKVKKFANGRANILVRVKGKDASQKPFVFSGHLDTVPIGANPWDYDPFSGEVVDGKLYGRGACDMKSGVAALIEAMIMIKSSGNQPRRDIIFAGTAGEEVDCIGAKALIKDGDINNAGAIMIAEPSNRKVFNAHKGALWIELKVFGKTAHGSMPEQGSNAIVHMNELLHRLKRYDFTSVKEHHLLGKPTLNIGTISGGTGTNVVPDQCTVTVDIRTTPEVIHEAIINDFHRLLEEMEKEIKECKVELNVMNDLPALANEENNHFVQLALDVNHDLYGMPKEEKGANYYTDASVYGPALNVPIVIYGPSDERLAHQPNEYVEIKQYFKAIEYYATMAMKY
ncbi:M20 family metallopeptidase [Virgibacillus sp. NKC19-3]|uniref:M20 family metallopeptidase n=1 Tax=Virgibacillus saliphilus TaxID=2831674 RepID=UPI001C9A5F38|nr:M20 family metallopeptidase [Virgibacillus sp. NKC19-3]MBY7144465.1 M20 family metallopeptidase [Virgibacillus sp. NKC19-3]